MFELSVAAAARRLGDLTVATWQIGAVRGIDREHLNPRRVRVIHNGVERAKALTKRQRGLVRRDWGASADELVVGGVADA